MSLLKTYKEKIRPELKKELHVKNDFQVPAIKKIVVNVGIGTYVAKVNSDFSPVEETILNITGQKPVVRKSRKSVSNFNKLREGQPNGLVVTLRRQKMFDFLEKLITITFPRIRDFKGISDKIFDGNGNINIGIVDHTVFPEVNVQDAVKPHGIQITIVTNTSKDSEARALLDKVGFPFRKKKAK